MEQNNSQNKIRSDTGNEKKSVEELMGEVSPELLLNLNQKKINKNLPVSAISGPAKIFIFIAIFDFAYALFLNIITGKPHIFIIGDLIVTMPWQLAFIDGLAFVCYGIYVVRKKRGEVDISESSSGKNEVQEIIGEAAPVLGIMYVLFGLLLIGIVIARLFIQGIF